MQPTKLQTFKSFFNPAERRPLARKGPSLAPIDVPPLPSAATGSLADDLTPKQRPGTSASRHDPSGGSFYQQRSMALSQPELPSTRRIPPILGVPLPPVPGPVLAPRKASLGATLVQPRPQLPHGPRSAERVAGVKSAALHEELYPHAEDLDEVTSLPLVFGHRRGGGSQDTSGTYAVVPDYTSSVTSGFLSRGPSTNSTSRSEFTVDYRRQSLEACSVQQDFFLGGMGLSPGQRSQLLVSLPESVVTAYCGLYEMAWLTSPTQHMWPLGHPPGLQEERLMAASRMDLDADSQDRIVQTSRAILKTSAGEQRLCRFVRWLLHSDIEDTQMWGPDELFDVPALTAPEVRDLLEPLRLTFSQRKRLDKHCRFIPHRLEASRGFASPVSYRGFH